MQCVPSLYCIWGNGKEREEGGREEEREGERREGEERMRKREKERGRERGRVLVHLGPTDPHV